MSVKKFISFLLALTMLSGIVFAETLPGVNRVTSGEYDYLLQTPSEYVFRIQGSDKEFILLDDTDGFFVMTKDVYGRRAFDPDDTQMFDPEDENNIAYWLNHDFLEKGNGTEDLKLPEEIIKNIVPNHKWDTEAGHSNGICPRGYTVEAGVALMSQTEWIKYISRFGVRDDVPTNGWWLRTPRALNGGPTIILTCQITDTYLGGTFGKSASDTSYYVRPVFYLSDEFFKNVRLDYEFVGQEVFNALARHYTADDMKGIYSDREIRIMGIDAAYEITIPELNVKTDKNFLRGQYEAKLSGGSTENSISAGSEEQYLYTVFPKNPNHNYEMALEIACQNLNEKAVTLSQYTLSPEGEEISSKTLLITGGNKEKRTHYINITDVPAEAEFVALVLKLNSGSDGTLKFNGWSIQKLEIEAKIIEDWGITYHLNPNDKYKVYIKSNANAPQVYTTSYHLEYRGRDYTFDGPQIKLSAKKNEQTFEVSMNDMIKGSAYLTISLYLNDCFITDFFHEIVVMDEFDWEIYNGMQHHGLNSGPGTLDDPVSGGAVLDRMMRAGFAAVRYCVSWSRLEKGSKGNYEYDLADSTMGLVSSRKMGDLLELNYSNDLYTDYFHNGPVSPEEVDGFVNYTLKMVERYPEVKKIEIWNEPNNVGFWAPDGNVYAYSNLVKAVGAAVRQVRPDIWITTGAIDVSKKGTEWSRQMFDLGVDKYVDAFSTHPYYHTALNDVRFLSRAKDYTDIIEDYGGWKDLIFSEVGWTTYGNYDLEPTMAKEYIKTLIHCDYLGVMCHIYNFKDNNEAFGLLNEHSTAKPTYASCLNYNIQTENATHITKLLMNDNSHTFLYKKNGKPLIISWCHNGENTPLEIPGSNVRTYDMYGNLIATGNEVPQTDEPYYILGADNSIFADGVKTRIIYDFNAFLERYDDVLSETSKNQVNLLKEKAESLAGMNENELKEYIDLLYEAGIQMMNDCGEEAFEYESTNMYHNLHKIGLEISEYLMTISNTPLTDSIERVKKLDERYMSEMLDSADNKVVTRDIIRHAKKFVGYIENALENKYVERSNIAGWNITANKLCDWAEYLIDFEHIYNNGIYFNTLPAKLSYYSGIPIEFKATVFNRTSTEQTGTLEVVDGEGNVLVSIPDVTVPQGGRITEDISYETVVSEGNELAWNKLYFRNDKNEYELDLPIEVNTRGKVSMEPSGVGVDELKSVTFKVSNSTQGKLNGKLKITPPEGWTLASTQKSFSLEAGGEQLITFNVESKTKKAYNFYDFGAEMVDEQDRIIHTTGLLLDFSVIVKAEQEISVDEFDGDITSWSDAYPTYLNPPEENDSMEAWQASDYAARIFSKWDENNLYLLADVYDLYHNNQNVVDTLYMGDSIQLSLDVANTNTSGYDDDDYEYGWALNNYGKLMSYAWHVMTGLPSGEKPTEWISVLRDEMHKTTRYLIKIPKSDVAPMELREGYVVGMNVVLNDANLLGGRDNFIEITQGTASGGKNPIHYRDWTLVGSQGENKGYWNKIAEIFNTSFEVSEMEAHPLIFDDIEGHWAETHITNANDKQLMNGMGNGKFEPDSALTIAQALQLVKTAFNLEDAQYDNSISDVSGDAWYAPATASAMAAGKIPEELLNDGKLEPDRSITREEFAAIIASGNEDTVQKITFGDADRISGWAKPYIGGVIKQKYMVGDMEGNFNPKNNLTRAEAAVVVLKISK